jgi:hypothetical protein
MTGGIENFRNRTGRTVVKKVVTLTYAMQGRWIELSLPRLVFKSHIVFVRRSEQGRSMAFVATKLGKKEFSSQLIRVVRLLTSFGKRRGQR